MTTDAARAVAYEAQAWAAEMNASYEHIPSKNKAALAGLVIDLCSQLDAAQAEIATLKGAVEPPAEIVAPAVTEAASDAVPDVSVPGADAVNLTESTDNLPEVRVADAAPEAEPGATAVGDSVLDL